MYFRTFESQYISHLQPIRSSMPKYKNERIEYEIEKTIDSILSKKMRGVQKSINRMILDSLNQAHSRRINEFSRRIIPDTTDVFGSSTSQQFTKIASIINKSILKGL